MQRRDNQREWGCYRWVMLRRKSISCQQSPAFSLSTCSSSASTLGESIWQCLLENSVLGDPLQSTHYVMYHNTRWRHVLNLPLEIRRSSRTSFPYKPVFFLCLFSTSQHTFPYTVGHCTCPFLIEITPADWGCSDNKQRSRVEAMHGFHFETRSLDVFVLWPSNVWTTSG